MSGLIREIDEILFFFFSVSSFFFVNNAEKGAADHLKMIEHVGKTNKCDAMD